MPLLTATKLVTDLATDVKRLFGDESGTQISDSDIIRWANLGQMEIIRRGKLNKKIASVSSVAGTQVYAFPSNAILSIESATFDGVPLDKTTLAEVHLQFDYVLNQGTPTSWYEFDDSMYLVPIPDTAKTLQIYYNEAPVTITSVSAALSVPDSHYEALVQYVLKLAYELDDEPSMAAQKGQEVEASLGSLKAEEYAYYPTITVLEDDL